MKTALKTEIPANKLHEIALAAKEIVEDRNDIGNTETNRFWAKIAERLGFSEEKEKDFRLEMVWTFDNTTVDEAEAVYEAFVSLFPDLKFVRKLW